MKRGSQGWIERAKPPFPAVIRFKINPTLLRENAFRGGGSRCEILLGTCTGGGIWLEKSRKFPGRFLFRPESVLESFRFEILKGSRLIFIALKYYGYF